MSVECRVSRVSFHIHRSSFNEWQIISFGILLCLDVLTILMVTEIEHSINTTNKMNNDYCCKYSMQTNRLWSHFLFHFLKCEKICVYVSLNSDLCWSDNASQKHCHLTLKWIFCEKKWRNVSFTEISHICRLIRSE